MTAPAELEPRIQEIGKRLFAAMADEGRVRTLSPIFGGRAVQRRVLARAAEDPHFKTQLFRFIDVYPSLRDSGDLVRHLRAYLADRGELPRPLDRLVGPEGGRRLPSWAVARLTERTMQRMAKGLIAGRDAGEVFLELKRLRRQHTAFTLDILGEACLSGVRAPLFRRARDAAAQDGPVGRGSVPRRGPLGGSPSSQPFFEDHLALLADRSRRL
jgi:RHH-type proline utilization regulon transcriptional repressor/proline dehydrogenase/delta 1-pyrroline-5-carboxylate dehydrogenase